MRGHSTWAAAAVAGGLMVLWAPAIHAQTARPALGPMVSLASGSIQGSVHDEHGAPLAGAMVSALGATTAFATTDRGGRFELPTLSPGPYLVRAHLGGYVASRGQIVQVRPSGRALSNIALRHGGPGSAAPVLAGIGATTGSPDDPAAIPVATGGDAPAVDVHDNHGEVAWRLRHARRSVLKDATLPETIRVPENILIDDHRLNVFSRAIESPARAATSLFGGTPFFGQVNVLTTGTFDTPQRLFTMDSFSQGIAYLSIGAPVGSAADWSVRGAASQGDLASWILAGSYVTRAPARHRYDVGFSYATQRYGGGNPAALRDVTDGSRNAGAVYGFDTFAIAPAVSLTYGTRYARYEYLADRGLLSPRVALTLVPADRLRINALAGSRAVAPGAEEFLPPGDDGIWLPPQRTFSSLGSVERLGAERTSHVGIEVERDLVARSTVSFRVFRQHVSDQLVTLFGASMPEVPSADLGHYVVANAGDVVATGWSAGLRTALTARVHASVDYRLASARWSPGSESVRIALEAPSAVRLEPERIHDVSAALETEVPETSTRVLMRYRVSNGFVRRDGVRDGILDVVQDGIKARPVLDGRFDVQVRQSLPFMSFSTARWEMLLALRNFFRETAADESLYDELLVVRPPKRVVGGLTMRF